MRNDPQSLSFAASFKSPVRIDFGDQGSWAVTPSQTTADRAKHAGLDVEVVTVSGDHRSCVPGAISHSIKFFNQFRQ